MEVRKCSSSFTNSTPHPCNALLAEFADGTWQGTHVHPEISRELQLGSCKNVVLEKEGTKSVSKHRNWAVKSHKMLFSTRQSNRTFVFYFR